MEYHHQIAFNMGQQQRPAELRPQGPSQLPEVPPQVQRPQVPEAISVPEVRQPELRHPAFTFASPGIHSAEFGGSDFSFNIRHDQPPSHSHFPAHNPPQSEEMCGQSEADKKESEQTVSTIFPRRKHGQQRKDASGPVVVTLDVLEQYSDISLTDAAKKLGISPTAVKKACRKLGVQRWPYKKNPDPVEPQVINNYDESYVRKLYRKYAAKPAKKPSQAAQAKVAAAKEAQLAAQVASSDISCDISDGSTGPSTPAEQAQEDVLVGLPQHSIHTISEQQSYGQRLGHTVLESLEPAPRHLQGGSSARSAHVFEDFEMKDTLPHASGPMISGPMLSGPTVGTERLGSRLKAGEAPHGHSLSHSLGSHHASVDFSHGLQPLHAIDFHGGPSHGFHSMDANQEHPHHTSLEPLDASNPLNPLGSLHSHHLHTSLEPLQPLSSLSAQGGGQGQASHGVSGQWHVTEWPGPASAPMSDADHWGPRGF